MRPGSASPWLLLPLGAFLVSLGFGCRALLGIDDDSPIVPDAGSPHGGGGNDGKDAAEDGQVDGNDGAPRFCASLLPPAGFCDDFDDLPFEAKWDNSHTKPDPGIGGGGTLGPDTSVFRSFPRSVKFTVPQLLEGAGAVSFLITTIPTGLVELDVYADVRVETEYFPSPIHGLISLVGVSFGASTVSIARLLGGAALTMQDADPILLEQPFPVGVWTTIEMRFIFDKSGGTAGSIHIYLDGVSAGHAALPATFYSATEYPRMSLGPAAALGPCGQFRMNADNVALFGTL